MSGTTSDVREKVMQYMEQTFQITFGDTGMSTDSNIFSDGAIDSFGLVGLIAFIESTFGVTFTEDEILSPELNTIDGIVAMVDAKRSS